MKLPANPLHPTPHLPSSSTPFDMHWKDIEKIKGIKENVKCIFNVAEEKNADENEKR